MGWVCEKPYPLDGFSTTGEVLYYFAQHTLKVVEAKPLHILVEGDIAIIQLMVRVKRTVRRSNSLR